LRRSLPPMSAEEVAGKIGADNAVAVHELGRSIPQEVPPRCAKALGVDVDDLCEQPGDAEAPAGPARASLTERIDLKERLVPDPCEPVLVPGGPGKYLLCGRTRTPTGDYVLDLKGGSG
jgi:hypothetical protein